MLPIRETFQNRNRVVTDGRYAEALFADRVQVVFQLDELDFAEWSPVR
jgi:hypothetical protein